MTDLMPRRLAWPVPWKWLGLIVLAWTSVGAMRGLVQIALLEGTPPAIVMRGTMLGSWYWIPCTILLAVLVRVVPIVPRRWIGPALLYAALGLAAVLVEGLWHVQVAALVGAHPMSCRRWLADHSSVDAICYLGTLGTLSAQDYHRRHVSAQATVGQLERALADAQLQVLTMQLQPHFLFNTLHLVSQLVFEDVAEAGRTLANLRSLLTESFSHATRREVALADELRFLEAYLAIQRQRFRNRLTYNVDAAPDTLRARIPHLVLQPLVENALRHGLEPRSARGTIWVSASRDESRLTLRIADDGVGLSHSAHRAIGGLGVANTRLRLQCLYGDDCDVALTERAGGGVEATIVLPYREPEPTLSPQEGALTASESAMDDSGLPTVHLRRAAMALAVGAMAVIAWALFGLPHVASGSVERATDTAEWLVPYSLIAGGLLLGAPLALRIAAFYREHIADAQWRTAAHIITATVLATAHLAVAAVLTRILLPTHPLTTAQLFGRWMVWDLGLAWDLGAYLLLIATTRARHHAGRYQDTVAEMARTQADLAQARVQSLRLRLEPALMFEALDAIANIAPRDPQRCEWLIRRVGELLRWLLGCAEQDWVSVRDELELLSGYLDIERTRIEGLSCEIAVAPVLMQLQLPPVLFQPLAARLLAEVGALEQRIVGLVGSLRGDIMVFELRVEAAAAGGNVAVSAVPPAPLTDTTACDVGREVPELCARLDALYGGAYRMRRVRSAYGHAFVLELPVRHRAVVEPVDSIGLFTPWTERVATAGGGWFT